MKNILGTSSLKFINSKKEDNSNPLQKIETPTEKEKEPEKKIEK